MGSLRVLYSYVSASTLSLALPLKISQLWQCSLPIEATLRYLFLCVGEFTSRRVGRQNLRQRLFAYEDDRCGVLVVERGEGSGRSSSRSKGSGALMPMHHAYSNPTWYSCMRKLNPNASGSLSLPFSVSHTHIYRCLSQSLFHSRLCSLIENQNSDRLVVEPGKRSEASMRYSRVYSASSRRLPVIIIKLTAFSNLNFHDGN